MRELVGDETEGERERMVRKLHAFSLKLFAKKKQQQDSATTTTSAAICEESFNESNIVG